MSADGQEFLVDVVLGVHSIPRRPGRRPAHTADYGAVAQAVVEVIEGPPVDLIETLAVTIAERCLEFDTCAP